MALADILNTLSGANNKLDKLCQDLADSTGRESIKAWHSRAALRESSEQESRIDSCRFAAEAKVAQALSFKAAKNQSAADAALKSLERDIEAIAQEKVDLISSQRQDEHDERAVRAFEEQLREIEDALRQKQEGVANLHACIRELEDKKEAMEGDIRSSKEANKALEEDVEATKEQLAIQINQHQQHLSMLQALPEKQAPTSAGAVALEELQITLSDLDEALKVKRETLSKEEKTLASRQAQFEVITRNCSGAA